MNAVPSEWPATPLRPFASFDSPLIRVVDDDPDFTTTLCELLEQHGYRVACYGDVASFLADPEQMGPGCVLADLRLPGEDGLSLLRHLRENGPALPVILISGFAGVPDAVAALKNGALDVLEKPFSAKALLAAVREAVARDMATREVMAGDASLDRQMASLTPREREMMEELLQGKTLKQAALAMGISAKTAQIHRAQVLRKMGVETTVQLLRKMLRSGPEVDEASP